MVAATDERIASASITCETMLPDLFRAHPNARSVFDRYGLHGCGGRLGPAESVGFFARTHGVDESRLLNEIGDAIRRPAGEAVEPEAASVADTIYRRFFLGGIVLILTAGATWGAWLLWQIGFAGKFTAASVHHVNAHGHAQIYGWVGLFIMGFAYQAFPRMWHTKLAAPRWAALTFLLMAFGIITRTIGMTAATGSGGWALAAAMVGGAAEIGAVLIFASQILVTFRRSGAQLEPYIGFVLAALFWFAAQAAVDVWHTYTTMTAPTPEALVWYVATYQAPLRDLQIHGLALFMILGVSIRMLPALFGLPKVPPRTAWLALAILIAAVAGESILFVAYRWSGNHALAALLMVPWIMLAVGCWMIARPWRLWRPFDVADRSGKFVRAAYAWLAVSLVLLLMLPVYQVVSEIRFSHAYYGAIRHAITVGFISLMIMGMAAKVVPTLNGIDPRKLSALWGPFVLVNLGCFLRVSLQTLTDWHGGFFLAVGLSGTLEVIGLAWWGAHLAGIIRRGKREAAANGEPESASLPPQRMTQDTYVTDVLRWHPRTADVFDRFGFTLLRNPVARRTIARGVTVGMAAAVRGVDESELLAALEAATKSGADSTESDDDRPPARVNLRILEERAQVG